MIHRYSGLRQPFRAISVKIKVAAWILGMIVYRLEVFSPICALQLLPFPFAPG